MKKVSFFENQTNNATLVVTLAEFKDHLRISGTDEDAELTLILTASQDKIACYLNQSLVPDTFAGNYAGFEVSQFEIYQFVSFKKFPLTSITSVSFFDGTDFIAQTITTQWVLQERDSGFPRILFKCPANQPSLSIEQDIPYPIQIIAEVGYLSAAAVPDVIKLGIMMYGALLHDNRGDCSECICDADGLATIPPIIRAGIGKYKIRETFG